MNLEIIPYRAYERGLPQEGNFILGQIKAENIFVYQAFNKKIADFAIANQKFGGADYSFSRMTWIKPNFLWMMYRSGWAEKENQNRILAIEIDLNGFFELLEKGVLTSHDRNYSSEKLWREKLDNSDVRIQWDPDHNPTGEKLKRKAVQIGMKDRSLEKFNNEFIKSITDITGFVKEQRQSLKSNIDNLFVINESIVEVNDDLKNKFAIPKNFISDDILKIVKKFQIEKTLEESEFERFLVEDGDKREEIINYIKNNKNEEFSRHLLKLAIESRKAGKRCMCEDLLLFSYFASKNKSEKDLDLIMEAKLADFDTWCGFDGEMVFYPLGFEKTKKYLTENITKFGEKPVEYFCDFTKDYLYNKINGRAFWYLY